MSSKAKAKGTRAETELLRRLNAAGFALRRREAGAEADLRQDGTPGAKEHKVLATRPDHGQWLFTIDMPTFVAVFSREDSLDIEVKRYSRFALHTIYERKFGRKEGQA